MMTEAFTTIATRPAELQKKAVRVRDKARLVWTDTDSRTRTAVQMIALLAVVIIAYSYSLTTLMQLANLNTPLAYVSLVPLISLVLAIFRSRPAKPEPAIHDRQTDYIIGIPLMAGALAVNLLLPYKLSAMFWVWRIDLLTLPFFVAGAVAVIFGVRVLWRQKLAVGFLFLAWPYPYTTVLLGVLNAFTAATLYAMDRIIRVLHVATPSSAVDNTVFTIVHNGKPFNLSVISACSGVSSVVGFLLVGTAFAAIIRGPLIRKILWLAAGMVLLWVFNLGRLTLVFWSGQRFGENFAINVLHPFIGLLLFTVGVGIMILFIRPFGLRFGFEGGARSVIEHISAPEVAEPEPEQRRNIPVPKVYLAVALVLVFAIIVGFSNVGLQSYNLVADVSGSPKVVSFIQHPVSPVGWTSRYEETFDWAAPLFGEQSTWNRYLLTPGGTGDLRAQTQLVADVIDTPDLQSFAAFGVEQCYQFHGYSLADVSQVSLTGGIIGQALSYTSQQYGSWTIVYWILPVKKGTGTLYERVVLYVQNQRAAISDKTRAKMAARGQTPGNSQQAILLDNQTFLEAYAREMIQDEANKSAPLLAKSAQA